MQTLTPKKDGSRRWLRQRWLWALLAAAAAIVLVWLSRRAPEKSPRSAQNHADAPSSYQPRFRWNAPDTKPEAPDHVAVPIRGTVYNMEGSTVAGASVIATTFENSGNVATPASSTLTDKQGRFTLHVPDGLYYVKGDKAGHGTAAVIAQNGDDIAVVLPRTGAVKGHVYDEKGQPIPQFTIDVVTIAPEDIASPPLFWSKRFDSPDGSFYVDRLPSFGGVLRASAPNYAPAFSPPIKIPAGQTESLHITLSHGCAMTGTVVDSDGKPLDRVLVNAETRMAAGMMSNTSVVAGGEAQTDEQGRFRLENVPTGEIVVRGYDANHAVTTATVSVSECHALQPVTLTMSEGGSLTGVVRRSDGSALPHAKLTVSHKSIGFVNTLSDAEGRYRFDKLPPVIVRLDVQEAGRHTTVNLQIKDGREVQQDLALFGTGGGELRGRVTAGGMPLAGAQLTVATNRGPGGMDIFYPRTEDDGTYSLPALPDGAYMVFVSSTNRIGSARIQNGSVQTVDLDVAVEPQRVAAPEMPPLEEPK